MGTVLASTRREMVMQGATFAGPVHDAQMVPPQRRVFRCGNSSVRPGKFRRPYRFHGLTGNRCH
jgi:hypothetical protein